MARPLKSAHESYERDEKIEGSSNRAFGFTFAVAGFLFGAISLWKGGNLWPYLLGGGAAFGLLGAIVPQVLAPLNYLWTKLGLLLHKIMNPLIMGLLFAVVITPAGLLLRLFSKSEDKDRESCWIMRDPPGPGPGTMPNQF